MTASDTEHHFQSGPQCLHHSSIRFDHLTSYAEHCMIAVHFISLFFQLSQHRRFTGVRLSPSWVPPMTTRSCLDWYSSKEEKILSSSSSALSCASRLTASRRLTAYMLRGSSLRLQALRMSSTWRGSSDSESGNGSPPMGCEAYHRSATALLGLISSLKQPAMPMHVQGQVLCALQEVFIQQIRLSEANGAICIHSMASRLYSRFMAPYWSYTWKKPTLGSQRSK